MEKIQPRRLVHEWFGGGLHVVSAGQGPPLLLLHDMPGSSAAHATDLARLAPHYHVVAPDLPGCGLSTTFTGSRSGMLQAEELLPPLTSLIDSWDLRGADIVGFGVGATIARRLKSMSGHTLGRVLTIGEADLSSVPDVGKAVPPDRAGSHVLLAWSAIRDRHLARMRIPSIDAPTDRIPTLPDPTRLHHETAELLRGEPSWPDIAGAVAKLERSSLGQPGLSVTDIDHAMTALAVPSARVDRPLPASGDLPLGNGVVGRIIFTRHGHVFVRVAGHGPPLVLIHQSMESSESLAPLIDELSKDFTVVAPDTLGCGHSDSPSVDVDAAQIADAISQVLDAMRLTAVRICATHSGCVFALELSRLRPDLVGALVLNGVPMFDPADAENLAREYFWSTPHEPDRHGLHLLRLWSIGVDMSRFFPWFRPRPHVHRERSASELHARFLTTLRHPAYWHIPYRVALTYDPRAALTTLRVPAIVAAHPADPLAESSDRAAALSEMVTARQLDPSKSYVAELAALIRDFDHAQKRATFADHS